MQGRDCTDKEAAPARGTLVDHTYADFNVFWLQASDCAGRKSVSLERKLPVQKREHRTESHGISKYRTLQRNPTCETDRSADATTECTAVVSTRKDTRGVFYWITRLLPQTRNHEIQQHPLKSGNVCSKMSTVLTGPTEQVRTDVLEVAPLATNTLWLSQVPCMRGLLLLLLCSRTSPQHLPLKRNTQMQPTRYAPLACILP
jgi:hypothetical protein